MVENHRLRCIAAESAASQSCRQVSRRLGAVSINVRITAVRKLAVEAADNGLLAPELASGITRVKGVASKGVRLGNWLSVKQTLSKPAKRLKRSPAAIAVCSPLAASAPSMARSGQGRGARARLHRPAGGAARCRAFHESRRRMDAPEFAASATGVDRSLSSRVEVAFDHEPASALRGRSARPRPRRPSGGAARGRAGSRHGWTGWRRSSRRTRWELTIRRRTPPQATEGEWRRSSTTFAAPAEI
jgi:hypothetical protein